MDLFTYLQDTFGVLATESELNEIKFLVLGEERYIAESNGAKPMLNEVPSFVVEDRHEAYCPKCEAYLSWQQVTNDEKHCLCDTEVEWHPVGQ